MAEHSAYANSNSNNNNNGIVFDEPKTAEDHFRNFSDVIGARIVCDPNVFALATGIVSKLVVLKIGKGRGAFCPKLNAGKYGIAHTALGNLLIKTKRIIETNTNTTHPIFGIIKEQWPEGLFSSTLVQPDAKNNCAAIELLADKASIAIEPTQGQRFYTPFYHEPGAGSGFVPNGINGDEIKCRPGCNVYPPYLIGIMTLDRSSLAELIRAFNPNWSNGPVFAKKNPVREVPIGNTTDGSGGLEKWV